MEILTVISNSPTLGYKHSDSKNNEEFDNLLNPKFVIDLTKDGWIKSIKFKNNTKSYNALNLVNSFSCSIDTRIKCFICTIEKNGHDCRVYKTPKSVATHIVGCLEHKKNNFSFPMIQYALQLVEFHSLSLQLKILSEGKNGFNI